MAIIATIDELEEKLIDDQHCLAARRAAGARARPAPLHEKQGQQTHG